MRTGRQQRLDVIVDEVVGDHGLQRGIVVDNEDRRLTIGVALLEITSGAQSGRKTAIPLRRGQFPVIPQAWTNSTLT